MSTGAASDPPPDRAAFEAAGLVDPAAPDVAERLALLDYLVSCGASIDRLVRAQAEEELVAVGIDLLLERGGLTVGELAARMEVRVDDVVEAYRLVGIEIDDLSLPMFEESELEFLSLLTTAVSTFHDPATREIMRAISLSLSTLSAAAISAFVGTVEEGLADSGDPLTQARVTTAAGEMGLQLAEGLRPLLRHHLRQGVQRQRIGTRRSGSRRTVVATVGFVDLVGYTASTGGMDPGSLIDFVGAFRERTHDVVGSGRGQVVKHIGDEIMFTCADPADGCAIGLALIDAFGDETAAPRGGVAAGHVVSRHGDLYGPVVNLASRLAGSAVPGELLAPAALVDDVIDDDRLAFLPAGRRQLKGFDEVVAVVSVERR